ncbi:lipid II flippase Amj family protein [Chryseosolibacter indicus]|uniref:Lipid II flippase Amj n=1 Tax=Chryseosolibacter indicus TaxID=2782351 RepID=A0ABS5VMZ7_9BACT|nr:lipid II flippase Amj family protein [Chryseosolibacter indicus]MBT1702491.1 DUF2837 family protein [Chryseosolibacter indicus]
MSTQVVIVLVLTFVINLISTLSYAVRIVGVRTGRVAISFALFNILVLISRTANGFQAPLLAKTVENDIKNGVSHNEELFRLIILSCSVGTIIGALLVPTFQRVLSKAVMNFSQHRSIPKLILHGLSKGGIIYFRENLTMPNKENITGIKLDRDFPWKIFILNVVAVGILTIGVLSAVYASYSNPDYRTTASNLSAFINGFATIILFTFIDPYLSSMTDDVILGTCSQDTFKKHIVYTMIARLLGTLLAQILFLPASKILAWTATWI